MRLEGLSQAEYLKFRCCMCPNINEPEKTKCPPKPFNSDITDCRFAKTYKDSRGWRYKVMGGLGESNYKARYQKPGKSGWKCMTNMEWRKSFDEAQIDLNAMAKLKGWNEVIECSEKSSNRN